MANARDLKDRGNALFKARKPVEYVFHSSRNTWRPRLMMPVYGTRAAEMFAKVSSPTG